MPTIFLRISGRVQGVFFRASARDQARALGITGRVRNTDDGAVEVLASGSGEALEAFRQWCFTGPRGANVTGVLSEERPETDFEGFTIEK